MIIQICVGSSCHIKGSPEIVELLQNAVEEHQLKDEITLAVANVLKEMLLRLLLL